MLKEALDRLIELGKETGRVTILPFPGDAHQSLICLPDGTHSPIEHAEPARNHKVTDLDSLKHCVATYGEAAVLWVSFDRIVAVLNDDGYRDERVTLDLVESPLFEALTNFRCTDEPKKLRRFLKYDCTAATIDPPELDVLISDLKFRTEDELQRQTGKTSDSMGHAIRAQVTGAEKIPDLAIFDFLPWPGIEEAFQDIVRVPCKLFVDPMERKIHLSPLPGSIEAAQTDAVKHLAQRIRESWNLSNCPVLCGTP